jgi:hypothetical protein
MHIAFTKCWYLQPYCTNLKSDSVNVLSILKETTVYDTKIYEFF